MSLVAVYYTSLAILAHLENSLLLINVSDNIGAGWNTFSQSVNSFTAFFWAYFVRREGAIPCVMMQLKMAQGDKCR